MARILCNLETSVQAVWSRAAWLGIVQPFWISCHLPSLRDDCYFWCFFDLLIYFSISRAKGAYMYNLPYAYTYALSDMKCITLILMHILIQPPSSYKSSFSFKTSDDAEIHNPSTYGTLPPLSVFLSKSISPWAYPIAGSGPMKGPTFIFTALCHLKQHSHPLKPPLEYYKSKDN